MQHSGQGITKDGETPQSARFWKLLLQVGGPAAGPRESAREKDHHGERFNPSMYIKNAYYGPIGHNFDLHVHDILVDNLL